MTYKTFTAVLGPDGRVTLPDEAVPTKSVRVLITILEDDQEAALTAIGDYAECLSDYEQRLARGEIRWQ